MSAEARRAAREGFTLLEVLVAIAIGGLVLLGARAMLDALAGGTDRIDARARVADREANGERLLRALVGRLEVGTQGAGEFAGGEQATTFTSWCDTPEGWQERCAVTLAFDSVGGRPVLAALLAYPGRAGRPGELVVLRDATVGGAFRYLNDAGAGGTWFRAWGRGITAPLAIGVILSRPVTASSSPVSPTADTLILRIGGRG